jgi:hypothetical protein
MARKQRAHRQVRTHDPKTPPLKKPHPPGAVHEPPVPEGLELQAQRLVRNAGSAENAKKAVDACVEKESIASFREDMFAERWGFASRKKLLNASRPLFPSDDSNWWATRLSSGRWIVWSQDDLSANDTFASFDEAHKSVCEPAATE